METVLVLGGLAALGKHLSKSVQKPQPQAPLIEIPKELPQPHQNPSVLPLFKDKQVVTLNFQEKEELFSGVYDAKSPMFGVTQEGAKKAVPFQGDLSRQNPNGMPVANNRHRYMSGLTTKMNNASPAEKIYVGPGLGIGPNVPAQGGYQQQYRVLPTNVGAYNLTTLPGRAGTGGYMTEKTQMKSKVTHNGPPTSFNLTKDRPQEKGRAGYETAPAQHGQYTFTERPTNRSEQTARVYDGLSFGPANSQVENQYLTPTPARNKGDYNVTQHNQNGLFPVPKGGYNIAATDIRPSVKGGMGPSHTPNPGRMNVIQNSQVGEVNMSNRSTTNPNCFGNVGNQSIGQNYTDTGVYSQNSMKGYANPKATELGIAKYVLKNNPLAINI